MMQIVSYSENSATARAVNGGRAGCEMMLTDVPRPRRDALGMPGAQGHGGRRETAPTSITRSPPTSHLPPAFRAVVRRFAADDDASTRSAQYVFKFPNGARFAYSSDIQLSPSDRGISRRGHARELLHLSRAFLLSLPPPAQGLWAGLGAIARPTPGGVATWPAPAPRAAAAAAPAKHEPRCRRAPPLVQLSTTTSTAL